MPQIINKIYHLNWIFFVILASCLINKRGNNYIEILYSQLTDLEMKTNIEDNILSLSASISIQI